jgi:hypothetical protein
MTALNALSASRSDKITKIITTWPNILTHAENASIGISDQAILTNV